jgi:hypothetical protein
MNIKQVGCLISLLMLTGCAVTGPTGTTDQGEKYPVNTQEDGNPPKQSPIRSQMAHSAKIPQAARSTEASSTHLSRESTITAGVNEMKVLTLPQLLYRLDRFTTLDPKAKKERLQQMEKRFAQLDPADRYELTLLLSRKGSSNKLLNRIISILDGLEEHTKDQIVLEILSLHRRYFKLLKQYGQERNKTIELNKKIERLKGLEQDLDKSNTRIQESLKPVP